MAAPSKLAIKQELWRRGNLSWMLDANQKELYKLYNENSHKVQTWLLARRSGKSFALVCFAIEECLKNPNRIVKYLAPTKLQLRTILRPLFKTILEQGCPTELMPRFSEKDYIYYFANGSEIQLAGSDNQHAEKLRGGDSHLAVIDEAGDVDGLDYIVKSIILPTTLITRAKVIIAGTPPKTSGHDFLKFIEECEAKGALIKKTVYDNPRITQQQIDELIVELGGMQSEACKRELFCEIVKDESTCVIPEFTDELEKEIVKPWERPRHYHAYVGMDLGYNDLTVALFAYYDFKHSKIVIEDELVLDFAKSDNNLNKLAKLLNEKEIELWTNPLTHEVNRPFLRASDINYLATNEIYHNSGKVISFVPAEKQNKQDNIHYLRMLLSARKIIISPRCTTLIRHLKNAKWQNINKERFSRSPDDSHYDALDAAIYLVRPIDLNKNPYPKDATSFDNFTYRETASTFGVPAHKLPDAQVGIYKKLFNIKK